MAAWVSPPAQLAINAKDKMLPAVHCFSSQFHSSSEKQPKSA
jgi:hypothetical protein